MKVRLAPVVAALLLASACGAPAGVPDTTDAAPSPSTTTAGDVPGPPVTAGSTTVPPPGETTTTSGRSPAPDFTLELGAGKGTYTLSEGSKPVYLVFWAEW